MDSPSDTLPTPGSRATAFLGSILTGSPAGAHGDSILIPGRLEPCEHDLSDWHAPSENRAPSPSALLDLARDFIEAYRAATWLFDAWDAPRRAKPWLYHCRAANIDPFFSPVREVAAWAFLLVFEKSEAHGG